MSLFKLKVRLRFCAPALILVNISFFVSLYGSAQSMNAFVKGKVTDGSTGKGLFGVSIIDGNTSETATSLVNGHYLLAIGSGKHSITYKHPGFQTKTITTVESRYGSVVYLDIILFPVSQRLSNDFKIQPPKDSVSNQDSIVTISFHKESRLRIYNPVRFANAGFDQIATATIQPGTDKNTKQLLKRLNGIIVQDIQGNGNLQSLTISGLGERYNQVLFNGAIFPGFETGSRAFPFEVLPVEAVEQISVQKMGNPSLPADFAGGTVEIKTKDFPDQNFYYVQAGAGFSDGTKGKNFFGDKRGNFQWLGFPGSVRSLPADFPTTRSQFSLNEKNPQEQVYLSKQLNNNLAPRNYGSSKPNASILLGFGKKISFKKGQKLGILAFINQQKSELIDKSTIQVAPDITANPFPFSDVNKVLVRSSASDVSYRYASQFSGIVNTSLSFGNNKISLKNFFGSHLLNTLSQRSDVFKYEDDSSAHTGINYTTEQRRFLSTQLSGEHALGANNKLKIEWLASYTYYRQQNPDERNFLLRQDSADKNNFEIALQYGADDITSNGRSWKDFTDHNFTGMVNIQMPFNVLHQPQVISGGIYIQNKYRVFFSDLFLTKGTGYFPLKDLLASERYFPGGLSVESYFIKKDLVSNPPVVERNRGNYTASSNVGAAYVSSENQLTKYLSVNWGLRVESNTQVASNSQYQYFKSYKNPQIVSLDKNIRVINFDFLPSVNINYQPVDVIRLYAAFFQTVNRPQLQELSGYRSYDPASFFVKRGNSLLANSNIENYHAGINWLPAAGTTVSISGFYKKIDRPIEYILSAYSRGNMQGTPHNTPPATVKGIDAGFKTKLDFIDSAPWLSNVSIFANGNLLRSKVSAGPLKSSETSDVAEHQLSGSPGYTINTGITFQAPRLPNVTILYSKTDDYITAVGSGARYTLNNGNTISATPDYWVKGREQFDIQVSQQFLKSKLQLIVGVNNLLSSPYIQYQDLNGNEKYDEPLTLKNLGDKGGFYKSGIDNTVLHSESQPTYYLRISYLFR